MRWLNEKYYALFQEYWRNFIGSNTWNRIDKDHALCEIWNYFRQTSYWWTHSLSCGWFTQGCMNYGRGAVHQNIKCRYNSCDIGTGAYLPKKVIFLGKIVFFSSGVDVYQYKIPTLYQNRNLCRYTSLDLHILTQK